MNIAKSGKELINICQKEQISLSEYAIRKEVEAKSVSREELFLQMKIKRHISCNHKTHLFILSIVY